MASNTPDRCPICESEKATSQEHAGEEDLIMVTCPHCGEYDISPSMATGDLSKFGPRHLLSGAIRNFSERGQRLKIHDDNLDSLLDSVSIPGTPIESIDLLLEHVARKMEHPGSPIEIEQDQNYPLLFARGSREFQYYFNKALRHFNYIESEPTSTGTKHRLTIRGWQRLEEIKQTKAKSDQAFVAMQFDVEETEEAWKNGISQLLRTVV